MLIYILTDYKYKQEITYAIYHFDLYEQCHTNKNFKIVKKIINV